MSRKGATSCHIVAVKSGALRHNRREVNLCNVNPKLSHLNQSWESKIIAPVSKGGEGKTIDKLIRERAHHYFVKNGRSAPGYGPNGKDTPPNRRAAFIREGCLVIKQETTMEEVRDFATSCELSFGVKCLGIWLHKDEGFHRSKYIEGDDKWKPNLHAHILFDFYDPNKGRLITMGRNQCSKLQDMAATALGMVRGEKSERKHTASKDFATQQADKRIAKLKEIAAQNEDKINAQVNTFNHNKSLIRDQVNEWHKRKADIESMKLEQADLLKTIESLREKSNNFINAATKAKQELDRLTKEKETAERSIKAQTTQLVHFKQQLEEAKKNCSATEKQLADLQAKVDRKEKLLNEADEKDKNLDKEIAEKIKDIQSLTNEITRCNDWLYKFESEQNEIAAIWEDTYEDFRLNTEGQPHNNVVEQLLFRQDRLESDFAPFVKYIIEKHPEVAHEAANTLPRKSAVEISHFVRNIYPSLPMLPLMGWGSAPGVTGSDPRRKKKGDDDDEDEDYKRGYSR